MPRIRRTLAATVLRDAISDARSDAPRWGHITADGVTDPAWLNSPCRIAWGNPTWVYVAYMAAYDRTWQRAVRDIWAGATQAERDAADAAQAENRLRRTERPSARAMRIRLDELTARVAALEEKN